MMSPVGFPPKTPFPPFGPSVPQTILPPYSFLNPHHSSERNSAPPPPPPTLYRLQFYLPHGFSTLDLALFSRAEECCEYQVNPCLPVPFDLVTVSYFRVPPCSLPAFKFPYCAHRGLPQSGGSWIVPIWRSFLFSPRLFFRC